MKTDILRLPIVGKKSDIKSRDLYVNESGELFRCGDPERNNLKGWPGDGEMFKVIPILEKTELSLGEIEDLKDFVDKNKLKDGAVIVVKSTFHTV